MPSPIQTAIGRALGAVAATAAVGKKLENDERQIGEARKEKEIALENAQSKAQEKEAADLKEASAVALEADLIGQGASLQAAKAYRLAQERGIAAPSRIIFDEAGQPIATYQEMGKILSDQARGDFISSRLRGKNAINERRALLEGKTHSERVENAVLANYGTKGAK